MRSALRSAASALLLLLALAGCGGGGGASGTGPAGGGEPGQGDAIVIDLPPQGGSDEVASATLEPGSGGGTSILVESSSGRVSQPAHVRRGGCEGVEEIAFELPDLFDGISGETVGADLDELRAGGYSIDIHDESGTVVACGVIE